MLPRLQIGHPSGLPRKYAGAQVAKVWSQSPDGSYRFVANLDSFAGNSGSGVFSTAGELVGILVAGATDFFSSGGCVAVNTCPNSSVAACQDFMAANSGNPSAACSNSAGRQCQGETVTGANVLSAAFVAESGCSGARPCLNGGTCSSSNACVCPTSTAGPNCIQTLETTFCNGQTGTGFLTCPLVVNGVSLSSAVNSASALRCGASVSGNTATSAHYTGQNAPEVYLGVNLTTRTTITVDTCGSTYDTFIAVWSQPTLVGFASSHSSTGPIAVNDDIGSESGFACTGLRSGITRTLDPGVYILQVEGYVRAARPPCFHCVQCVIMCFESHCCGPILHVCLVCHVVLCNVLTRSASNAAGAYAAQLSCSCGGGTCDAAYVGTASTGSPYTFSQSTRTCSDVNVNSLDTCASACAVVVANSYGTTRSLVSATYAENTFFAVKECKVCVRLMVSSRDTRVFVSCLCRAGSAPSCSGLHAL